jgi:hypothetical protein
MPSDFPVTRVEATWQGGCDPPTILIELSDGKCPTGGNQRLDFLLVADAIDGSSPTVVNGLNTLMAVPDTNGITVQYHRPNSLPPGGTWGSCTGMPGTISLLDEPGTTKGTNMQASFELDLDPCDGSASIAQSMRGTFNVTLARGREDACPSM